MPDFLVIKKQPFSADDICSRFLFERLTEMIRELREKEMVVVFVEAWLSGLTEREKWLIEQLYFEQQTYAYIISSLRTKHGVSTSKDGVRRMKKAALEKIFEMAG